MSTENIAKATASKRTIGIWLLSLIAGIFGVMTLKSGYSVLFIDGEARVAAGHYVPFVLWFNFISGFLYIITAAGLWLMRPWSAWLSLFLAVCIVAIYAAFGLYIFDGGEYEMRTVVAMLIRSSVWITIAFFTWQRFLKK
ncbi:MAG: hypothetical protein IMF14_06835 [Proteobacteria bacterium]|nr:hypothetical protein [Pseudomonadota bacterium]